MQAWMRILGCALMSAGVVLGGVLPALALPAALKTEDADGRVNIRSKPSTQSMALEELLTGSEVEVLNLVQGQDGAYWYYVRSPVEGTAEGWIRADFARLKLGDRRYGMLRGEGLEQVNVRSGLSTQSSVVHRGLAGDVVAVQRDRMGEDGYRWYSVEFPSGLQGWVREDVISVWPKGCVITCPSQ